MLIGAFCVVFRHLCGFSIVVLFSVAALVFFCANFSSLLMSVFIFFSAVECCLLRFVFFQNFRIINWGFPRLDVFIDDDFSFF